jgi:hypothetical protein
MSVRLRMSVLRLRQLSAAIKATLRPDVLLDKADERHHVRIRRQPTARVFQLAAGTLVFAGLVPIARRSEVMQAADKLLVLTRPAEDRSQSRRSREVLAPLEVPLGPPERRANPRLGRRPIVVVLFEHRARY